MKIKEILKKEPHTFQVYLLFLACTLMCSIFRGAGNMDELWNYTFASNIANGLLPYRDFNMLQTPLSAVIPGVVMAITGRHLIITRIMGAMLHAGIATFMYRISRRFGGGVFLSMIPGCGFLLLFIFNVFFEYSGLIVFFEILLIDLDTRVLFRAKDRCIPEEQEGTKEEAGDIQNTTDCAQEISGPRQETTRCTQETTGYMQEKSEMMHQETTCIREGAEHTRKYISCADIANTDASDLSIRFLILTGIIGGMAILTKQTFGLFIAIASWLSAAFISKNRLRAFFLRGIGSALFCTWMLFFFLITGTFDDCIDLCLRGISSFAKPWYYWVYMSSGTDHFLQGIFLPPLFMCGTGFAFAARREKIGKMMGIAILYILFSFINMYPLANGYHINTCFGPAFILLVPVVLALTNPVRGKKSRIMRKVVNILAAVGVLATMVVSFIVRPIDVLVTNGLRMSFEYKHYEGIFLSESTKNNMAALKPVIEKAVKEGKEIYILDNTAELYFIPYDIYHNHLDMFLYGNSGSKTPEEILEDSYEPGAVYLMAGDDRKNTQFPWTEMRAFKKRLEKKEDVGPFEMYAAPEK